MIRNIATAALLAIGLGSATGAQQDATSGLGAVLRGLDKVNGQTIDLEVPTGGLTELFGLTVELADCRYPADNPTGDAFGFLTIRDTGQREIRFQGWMIASSPALNALDHSRYDVWLLRCITS
ncbi:DUF2155 domain-containing protein [Sedimentitalea sp. HM32M-2]|uniref:DUF2155 domain-containing protein n=1 Tax=Sedimentitalea sp. HM32M-2 TaxID=3351566 RepID=UPI00363D0116